MAQQLRFYDPNTRGLGSILGQDQILHATTKTWCSQISKLKKIQIYFLKYVINILKEKGSTDKGKIKLELKNSGKTF